MSDHSAGASAKPLFDISGVDLSACAVDRDAIAEWVPHRNAMALLDAIVWHSEDLSKAIAVWNVRDDEFWVDGHFPGSPILPGVLMVEAAAQVACYQFNARRKLPTLAAFLRIEKASFRAAVKPGEQLYILSRDVKFGRRQFKSDAQGLVGGRVAFDCRISGMIFQDGRL